MPNRPRRWLLGLAGTALVASLAWLLAGAADQAGHAAQAAPATSTAAGMQMLATGPGGQTVAASNPAERLRQRAQWEARLARAQATRDDYAASTRYPHESRPAAEQTDQLYPNRPVEESRPLHDEYGQIEPDIILKTRQSRVFVGSGETVSFSIAAFDRQGQKLALQVESAQAQALPNAASKQALPQMALPFNDRGSAGDQAADDASWGAALIPGLSVFAQFHGAIRVSLAYRVGQSQGRHFFDIYYSPQPPAVWAGAASEGLSEGSLLIRLPVTVYRPGRYLASARVDDADGKPLALLSFNEELAAGAQEIRLQLFGKLVRDSAPRFPLSVRDIEAYLLKEGFPDRELMPRLVGNVLLTASYPLGAFSGEEWQSEERQRYLTEYSKDVDAARQQLDALDAADCQASGTPSCATGS